MQAPVVLGVIVANRGFFPDHLCRSGRATVLQALKRQGIGAVTVGEEVGKHGAIESLADARACAELFRRKADRIDGVLVTLPNFGDERAVANALRWANLGVPVLVQAFPDDPARMDIRTRRDSFCGKLSLCNNLRQYGIEFSLTDLHTVSPDSDAFAADLRKFAGVCRVVRGLRHLRIGMLGARPAAFNTVRFSEKLLEAAGISVETADLSELTGQAGRLKSGEREVRAKLATLKAYTCTSRVGAESLLRMAKLGVAIDRWTAEKELRATAIQCWTALEEFYGVVPCSLMSMMSEKLLPSACETDVGGAIAMLALQCATGLPAALLDWNNNYGDDPDKGVFFHCSNLPRSFLGGHHMDYQAIVAGTVGKERACGTLVGRIRPGDFTYCRVATDDLRGEIAGYVGQGEFTDDPLETFGGYGVFRIPDLQGLMTRLCECGFEHHVAVSRGEVAESVYEALARYKGWDIYGHDA
jgi:L-fucose isomerase-like protein